MRTSWAGGLKNKKTNEIKNMIDLAMADLVMLGVRGVFALVNLECTMVLGTATDPCIIPRSFYIPVDLGFASAILKTTARVIIAEETTRQANGKGRLTKRDVLALLTGDMHVSDLHNSRYVIDHAGTAFRTKRENICSQHTHMTVKTGYVNRTRTKCQSDPDLDCVHSPPCIKTV